MRTDQEISGVQFFGCTPTEVRTILIKPPSKLKKGNHFCRLGVMMLQIEIQIHTLNFTVTSPLFASGVKNLATLPYLLSHQSIFYLFTNNSCSDLNETSQKHLILLVQGNVLILRDHSGGGHWGEEALGFRHVLNIV